MRQSEKSAVVDDCLSFLLPFSLWEERGGGELGSVSLAGLGVRWSGDLHEGPFVPFRTRHGWVGSLETVDWQHKRTASVLRIRSRMTAVNSDSWCL